MNNTCISSSVSFRCRGPLSFSFNDCSGYLNDGFDRNPLLYAPIPSFPSLPCCCCCANSLHSRGSSCLYGLRQSNLIQWSPRKRLILNGLDRFSYGRLSTCDADTRFFREKDCIFKERRVGGKGRKMGKGRFRSMVFEEKCEWDGFSDGGIDEVEVMLSLLTEDVSDECNIVGERRGQSYRKIEVVERGNNGDNNVRRRKKNVDSGVLESRSEVEYESKMIGSREGETRRKEENRRIKERGVLLRRENVKVRREDERAKSMREVSGEMAKEEQRMNLFIESQRERSRLEERENLSTKQDHKQRLRKDGSSCSSYFSVASGDLEMDDEIQHEQEEFEEEISKGYLRDSEKSVGILSHEVKEEMKGHEKYSREQGAVSSKETARAGFSGASSSVAYDWRKKSEKKLSDSSVQEIKSSEELAQKQSSYREVNQGTSGKTVNFDEEIRERNDQVIGSESRMKSKQSNETLETQATDVKTYSTTGKSYRNRDEGSHKSQSSVQKESDYRNAHGQISIEEDSKSFGKFTEASKLQEIDIRGTSTAVRQAGIRMKSQEEKSSMALSTLSNNEEQQRQSSQTSGLQDSRKKYQQRLIEDSDSRRSSILRRESDARMKRNEIGSSGSYKSDQKLTDQRSEMIRKRITTQETSNASQETIDSSIALDSNTNVSVLDDGCRRTDVVMEPPSQLAVSGSIHVESATEEAAGERLHGSFTASPKQTLDRSEGFHYQSSHDDRRDDGGQSSKFISDEDRLASADLQQKSTSHYVGEFVQKVTNEIYSSELHEVKKTHEIKSVHEDEQQSEAHISSHSSQVSQSKEQNSGSSSRSSATKGPSDKVSDDSEPSVQEHPEAEATGSETTTEKVDVRRTGKSLWHVIGDIVRLRWHSRSETLSSGAKSGGKSSPNQSTSSETWFSGHDPEENIDLNTKSDGISLVEESTSVDHRQEGIVSSGSQGEVSNSSNSQGDPKQRGAGSKPSSVLLEKDSSVEKMSFQSGGATSDVKESSLLLPSLELKIPPAEKISKAREGEGSSSSTVLQTDQPILTTEKSRPDGKKEALKRKSLGRSDQLAKDKFDEWEEAYRLETEHQRIDEMFMREALLEAKKAADSWEVPVGAVLVQDGRIIARGYNLVEELRDSTAHAEINCIREASNVLRTWRLSESTLYVTLEPCPMCAGAIFQARIDTVVWGAPNKLLGADGSWIRLFPNGDSGNDMESTDKPAAPVHPFHPNIKVRRRVLAAECADTMQQFFQLRRKKDKQPKPTTPPSCLPISHHPSKFMTKMHNAFHIMFCL